MAHLLGQMTGGLILLAVLTRGLLWIFRKHRSPPTIVMMHVGAWLFSVIMYGYGNADGGPWNPEYAWLIYGVPAVLLCALALYGDARREKPPAFRAPLNID